MKKFLERFEIGVFVLCSVLLLIFVFRPVLLKNFVLFPANLMVSTYAPWKYEPVPEYPNGPANKPMGFDDIRQFFPNRKILKEEFSKFQIPLWNPYIYAGVPFAGSFDTAVWYPLSWIAAIFPVLDGWNFLVIIQPLLSLLFMYLFLRSLKFPPVIAVLGAFAYAFSGWMIVYWQEILVLEHSFLWLPLALYASNRVWDYTRDRLGFFLFVTALVCAIFGGFMQMSIYVYICVILWNVYRFLTYTDISGKRKKIKWVFWAIGISLLIVCIQCIPSIEAFFLSPRGTDTAVKVFADNLLPFQYLITLISPDYWGTPAAYSYFGGNGFYFEKMIFIGIIPLIFTLYAMISARTKAVTFWMIVALAALSMGFALPTSWIPYYLKIPVLSNSYPTRIFSIWTLSAVILSCYGIQAFIKNPDRKRMILILGVLSLCLFAAWITAGFMWCHINHDPQNIILCRGELLFIKNLFVNSVLKKYALSYATTSLRNLIIPTMFLVAAWIILIVSKYTRKYSLILIYIFTVISGLYFAQKYVYFSERRFAYPDLPVIGKLTELSIHNDRIWGYGHAFIEKNIPQYYRWFSTDGYGNLSSKRYAELLSTIVNNGKLGGEIRRSDTDIYEASEWDPFSSANPYRLRMMSLLGVRYVLESKKGELKDKIPVEKRFTDDVFKLVWQDPTWRIWEYKEVLPRVIFADSYLVKKNNQEIIDTLYDPKTDLSRTVILESEPQKKITETQIALNHPRSIITKYEMNTVEISTDSDADGFVVVMDNYYPGWSAQVDGKDAPVYRGDYAFKAVFVPKGQHQVIFRYLPASFLLGLGLSFIGIVLLLVFLFIIIK